MWKTYFPGGLYPSFEWAGTAVDDGLRLLRQTAQLLREWRFLNCGQSWIAARRFIVVDSVAEAFLERFQRQIEELRAGDLRDRSTTLAPMAREDLRTSINKQVEQIVGDRRQPIVADEIERHRHPFTGEMSAYGD